MAAILLHSQTALTFRHPFNNNVEGNYMSGRAEPFALWCLCKQRNRVVFQNTTLNPNLHKQCINQAVEYFYSVGKIKMQRSMVVVTVRWNKPPHGWFKLNTDGASMGNPGKAGRGGLTRDSSGNWVKGFSRSLGYVW